MDEWTQFRGIAVNLIEEYAQSLLEAGGNPGAAQVCKARQSLADYLRLIELILIENKKTEDELEAKIKTLEVLKKAARN